MSIIPPEVPLPAPSVREAEVGPEYRLHLFCEPEDDCGQWSAWLDTEVGEQDGLCLAIGHDRAAVLAEAEQVLRLAAAAVQRLA